MREVCGCIYHVNVEHAIDVLARNKQHLEIPDAPPPGCVLPPSVFTSDNFVTASVCGTPSLSCYKGECSGCGPWKVYMRPKQAEMERSVTLLQVEDGPVTDSEGVVKTRKQLSTKIITLRELCDFVCTLLLRFLWHWWEAGWQSKMYRYSRNGLEPGQLLVVVDFAENLSLTTNYEVQSEHWCHRQVSLYAAVAFVMVVAFVRKKCIQYGPTRLFMTLYTHIQG